MYLLIKKSDKDYSEKIKNINVMLGLMRSQERLDKVYEFVDMQYTLDKKFTK